jgi:hypothetical protein
LRTSRRNRWSLILHAEKLAAAGHGASHLPQQLRLHRRRPAGGEQIPLCRLRCGGSAHSFGFAIYSAARERYEDTLLRTGPPTGTPQEALDIACTVRLTGLGHEPGDRPSTNLRPGPLSGPGNWHDKSVTVLCQCVVQLY